MKRLVCLSICLFLVSFTVSTSALPRPDSEDVLERRAWQAWEDGETDVLFETCEKAIVLDPTITWPYAVLAKSLILDEEEEEAYELLSQGFEAGAESAYMRFYRGSALHCLDRFEEARAEYEMAIVLTSPNDSDLLRDCYECLGAVLEELKLDHEASLAAARYAVLDEPDNPESLLKLWVALDMNDLYGEALPVYIQWMKSQPEMAGVLDTVQRAEEQYQGGMYEEAAALYGQLAGEDYLPAAVVMHYTQALMRLSRHEDALAELDYGMGEIIPSPISDLLLGDVYFELGDQLKAETYYRSASNRYDEELYGESMDMPYGMAQAAQRLQALAEHVPTGAMKTLEDPEWIGYAKAAEAIPFVLMREDAHNVLCCLRWSKDTDGFVIEWVNDKAVYQGDYTPIMTVWWHLNGELEYKYINDKKPSPGEPDSQTYWFDCDEETDEWVFVGAEYRYDKDSENVNAGFHVLRMSAWEGRLIQSLYEYRSADGDTRDVGGDLPEIPYDVDAYALKVFDIARCDADFAILRLLYESVVAD
ncbi:MAG: hypothetical protein FWF86_07290 [Clostridia bacterium]|nr:hypothetical protein [Clostridia bacterium]